MLPNHAPLVIAEQFGTLAALSPVVSISGSGAHRGPIKSRHRLCGATSPRILTSFHMTSSSCCGTRARGLPANRYSQYPVSARTYRCGSWARACSAPRCRRTGVAFRLRLALRTRAAAGGNRALPYPLPCFGQPRAAYVMLGFNILAADSDAERASWRAPCSRPSSTCAAAGPRSCLRRSRATKTNLAVPAKAMLADVLACSAIGSADTVRSSVAAFIARTRPDELLVTSQIFDHHARLRSYEIAAQIQKGGTSGGLTSPAVRATIAEHSRCQAGRMVDARKLRVASEVRHSSHSLFVRGPGSV